MGRKHFDKTYKRGPGKKAKRQQDPENVEHKGKQTENKVLSSRQKKRFKNRLQKQSEAKQLKERKELIKKQTSMKSKITKPSTKNQMGLEKSSPDPEPEKFASNFANLGSSDEDESGPNRLLEDDDYFEENDDFYAGDSDAEEQDESQSDDEKKSSGDEEEQMDLEISNDKEEILEKESISRVGAHTDISLIDERIKENMLILGDFKKRAKNNLPRKHYIDQMLEDLSERYSYNEWLLKKLYDLFPKELLDFIQSNEVDRPITIRTNTLKTRRKDLAQALINRGVNLDPLEKWSKVGLVVYSSQVPLGATPEYLAGHYILQGASSMLPVMALAPKQDERILDLCAAPGGKTTYISQLMKNTGIIFANDANKERCKAIVGNCHRMGCMNVVVCNEDGREFRRIMHSFDRVLVDAPCSGTGVIAKDPSVKSSKDENDLKICTLMQKQLILSAIDCCRTDGYVVYSTCSILTEENEEVIQYALNKRHVKIEEVDLFGESGHKNFKGKHFHPFMSRTRRYYPHIHNMDGFFLCKLKKLSESLSKASHDTKEDASNLNPINQGQTKLSMTRKKKKFRGIGKKSAII